MSWERIRLGDFLNLKRGYDLPDALRQNGDTPIVSSSGITGYHNVAKVEGPGVVTGRYGTLGDVYFIPDDFWPHNTALYVEDFKGNDPKFCAYFLRHILRRISSDKAAVPGVNRNDLHARVVIVTRNADQQRRIAAILSAYDDLIATNRRRMALLEQAARLLYREWFVHLRFPGHEAVRVVEGVPEGWERKTINEIATTVGGGTPSTGVADYWDGDITWVVPSDVTKNNSIVLLDSERKITEKGLRASSARLVPANTILMTSRASVGFFALMDREVCTNQGFINIIPSEDELRMYLLFNLMQRVEEIRSNAKGTTYPEINKSAFRGLSVLVPTIATCRAFTAIVEPMIGQIRNLKQQSAKLTAARDLLLPRLMNGEISV